MKKMLAMFLALMTVLCFGTAGLAEEPIKLGSLVGITAPDPSIALAMDRGFQLAVEEVNAAGGIAGRQLEYISYDVGAWDTREAINGYTYLADEEGCVAIMGCPVSDIGLALIDYAADYQVPLVGLWINVACTHDENDVPYPYMYLAQPTNNDMAEIVAAYMLANGRDKVAILYNQQQSYHTSQVSSFSAYFTAHGGEIVTEQTFTSDTMDFSTILTMIKETGVNSLYYPMDSTTGVNVLSTLDGLGMMTGDFAVFGDVNYSAPFTDMLPNKDVANRIFFPLNVDSSDDKLIGLATDYLSKYGRRRLSAARDIYRGRAGRREDSERGRRCRQNRRVIQKQAHGRRPPALLLQPFRWGKRMRTRPYGRQCPCPVRPVRVQSLLHCAGRHSAVYGQRMHHGGHRRFV